MIEGGGGYRVSHLERCWPSRLARITWWPMVYRFVETVLSQPDAGHTASLAIVFVLEASDLSLSAVHLKIAS